MAYLGEGESLTQLFTASPDPTARTQAIELSASFGLPLDWFVKSIAQTSDEDVCRSAILALGQYSREAFKSGQLEILRTEVSRAFARFPREPGVTAAFLWLDRRMNFDPHYSNRPDDAVGNISFFAAASFCRWLSEREGIEEDQMCFPTLDQINPDMTLPADYLQRSGYRLPTESEWELACRSGTTISWSFGLDAEHFRAYANGINNPANHTWRFATGKPNDFGLFDMHGNVREWCVNVYAIDPQQRQFSSTMLQVSAEPRRVLRGGSFNDVAVSARSASLTAEPPEIRSANVGMRLVRTLPAADEPEPNAWGGNLNAH